MDNHLANLTNLGLFVHRCDLRLFVGFKICPQRAGMSIELKSAASPSAVNQQA
jgi:hypothetical protein